MGYIEDLEFTYKIYLISDDRIIDTRNCKFSLTKNILSLDTALAANAPAAPQSFQQTTCGKNKEKFANVANETFELVHLSPDRSAIN